jgi:hypothetical protein
MLSAEEILAALQGIDRTVALWVLAHLDNGHGLEAQRLLLSQLPQDRWEWGRELIASITRDRIREGIAS